MWLSFLVRLALNVCTICHSTLHKCVSVIVATTVAPTEFYWTRKLIKGLHGTLLFFPCFRKNLVVYKLMFPANQSLLTLPRRLQRTSATSLAVDSTANRLDATLPKLESTATARAPSPTQRLSIRSISPSLYLGFHRLSGQRQNTSQTRFFGLQKQQNMSSLDGWIWEFLKQGSSC